MFGNRLIKSNNAGAACTTDTVQILDGTPLESIATYQLDGAATSIPNNTYPGTFTNPAYAAGEFGQAAEFNGSSSVIRDIPNSISTSLKSNNAFTYSFWIKFNSLGSQSIIQFFNDVTSSVSFNGTNFYAYIYNSSAQQKAVTNSATVTTGVWYNVVFKGDSNGIFLYVNNNTPASTSWGGDWFIYTNATYKYNAIGARQNSGGFTGYVDGLIDQVRIFNTALTSDQVTDLYNETVATASNSYISIPSCIAYYKMSDATDQTGSYDGTPTNVNFNVAGKFGNAEYFNGSSSNISLPTSIKPADSIMSISLWVSNNSTARKSIFYLEYNNSNALLALENNSYADSTALSVLYNNAAIITPAGSTLPTDGSWHHIVVTASATEVKLYKNGSQIGSTASITVNTNALTEAHIGVRHYNNDLYWDGKIDQVRIFNRAITENEVETLYDEVQCIPTIVPTDNFNTVIYTGNGNDNRSITGVGFEPDFIWLKNSSNNWGHTLVDSVRGLNAANVYGALASDQTAAETTTNPFGAIKTLDIDGFTIKDGTDVNGYYAVNRLNSDYVAWCWKAGGAPTATNSAGAGNVPTAGSVKIDGADSTTALAGTLAATSISANTEAGFSIVKYSGTSTNATIGHGLDNTPELYITKATDGSSASSINWNVYSKPTTATDFLRLNQTAQASDNNLFWNDTEPTDSVFSVANNGVTNGSGTNYIAYCFHSVDGYSKIGSYVGTGASGNFIVTGFRPAFVMYKLSSSSGHSWVMIDNTRSPSNPRNKYLFANTSGNEGTVNALNFTDNGFELLLTDLGTNALNETYIFLAIAEEVFVPDNFFNDDSTVATYKLDGDAGDDSGNGNNGVASNVTYAAGEFDDAAVFNGSSSKISVTGLGSILASFSISSWFNAISDTNLNIIYALGWDTPGDSRIALRVDNGSIKINAGTDNTWRTLSSYSTGVWYNIVTSYNDNLNQITIYINGQEELSYSTDIGANLSRNFVIGEFGSASRYFNGKIDQVRIFNRALDAGEVAQLANE